MPPPNAQQPDHPTTQRPPLWMRIVGLKRRQGRWLRAKPTLRGWLTLGVLGAIAGSAAFAEYSMQPDFCRSCHIMEPYYQAWHTSTHKNVPCVDCHFEPGFEKTLYGKWQASSQAVKYLTRTYGSKPHAEIRDSSCLRDGCHERRVLEGLVQWTVTTQHGNEVKIHFDHAPHMGELRRGKQLRCVSCHSQIVQGQHLVVTLDTCFICHFKGLKHGRDEEVLGGCGSCHGAPANDIRLATGLFNHKAYLDRGVTCENCHADSVRGDGAVPKQQCWGCHNKPADIARYSESGFIHDKHVSEHKVECTSCHIQIEHNLTASAPRGHSMLSNLPTVSDAGKCGQCHEGTHAGPAELYMGTGGRGVPDMPSPMYRAQVDCIACHQEKERHGDAARIEGQTYVAAQQRCDYCHGNHYSDQLDTWKKTISKKLAAADAAVSAVEAQLQAAALDARQALAAQRLLDDARFNVDFVKLGRGVHNVIYATALLSAATEQSQQAADLIATNPQAQPQAAARAQP